MIGSRWKKLLTIFGAILTLNFIFFTFASAEDLNGVMKKGGIHPKLSSRLWESKKEYETRAMAAQAYAQSMNLRTESPDKITVYLISEPGTIIDEGSLQAYGAEIIKSADNVWKVRAPINMLETIADNVEGIAFIKLPDRDIPSAIESEGVGLTGASPYHSAGYTGAGVKVAVIDLGFAGLSSAISSGELPNTVVSIDCTGSSCIPTDFSLETDFHGTAVAEIVHDMAPESALYLIKAAGRLDLKYAKDYAVANGIKVINRSAAQFNTNFYSGECYNSNAVCTAKDAYFNGILWVNSMGNYAKRHYGATFTDADGDRVHNVSGDDVTINIIKASAGEIIDVRLTWDAWPTTDQDYDLFLFDSDLNSVASSMTHQTGTQPPTEEIYYTVPATGRYHLVIGKYSATSDHRLAVFSINHDTDPAMAANSIVCPADATGVLAVGAIDYENWITGPQESFSSQGPTNDGRTKPEISGPDNVTSYIYGSFPGTSAASPYVAGAAALILSLNPTYSVSQLWNALTTSTIDMGSSGQDNIYGYGRLNLPPVLKVTTGLASSVTTNSAALNGTINPNGISTTYYFEYGTTISYGSKTIETTAGSGTNDVTVSADLTGLSDDTTYHFRLVAENSGRAVYGVDATFTTINADSDEDGIDDSWEIQYFGNLTTATNITDSDGDGLLDRDEYANETDPTNIDSDADGMTDGWEVSYGLNPLVDDANEDLDGDGISNLEEYIAGSHPGNREPYKPDLYLPPDGQPDMPLTPELQTGNFSDQDKDQHARTEWQISTDSTFSEQSLVLGVTSSSYLISFTVPELILDVNTQYFWRVRFTDSDEATSDWADPFSFLTIAQSGDDQNPQNGVPDSQQADCLGIFDPGEVPPNTVCVNTMVGNAQVGIEGSA
ncbi:S8 family serine peptidase, partial [Thermodesulfobacteriota bacterium]